MALRKERLLKNCTGPFFVDSSCIDCGSCWRIDPQHFASSGNKAYVHNQPNGKKEIEKAFLALIDCPVAAIGAPKRIKAHCSSDAFPILVTTHFAGEVYYCGWSSKKSFGASSWLILNSKGNILIDSPRWSAPLAKQIKKMGGVGQMVLTHKDDIADSAKWAKAFCCERWMHKDDINAAPEVENQLTGLDTVELGNSIKLIPTPGHTKGSIVAVLGSEEQILFSGDHLWWNIDKDALVASKDYCWWNWTEQLKSVKKLINLDVKWLLPGHGYAKKFAQGEWKLAIENTLKHEEEKAIRNLKAKTNTY